MDIFNILSEMEELIAHSHRIPLTKRVMVDEDRLLDYLDRIRASLPDELHKAKNLMQERDRFINDSKREAERIKEHATQELEKKAVDSEITQRAQAISEEIVSQTQEKAKYIEQGAFEYADDLLAQVENNLQKILIEVHENRSQLQPAIKTKAIEEQNETSVELNNKAVNQKGSANNKGASSKESRSAGNQKGKAAKK